MKISDFPQHFKFFSSVIKAIRKSEGIFEEVLKVERWNILRVIRLHIGKYGAGIKEELVVTRINQISAQFMGDLLYFITIKKMTETNHPRKNMVKRV